MNIEATTRVCDRKLLQFGGLDEVKFDLLSQGAKAHLPRQWAIDAVTKLAVVSPMPMESPICSYHDAAGQPSDSTLYSGPYHPAHKTTTGETFSASREAGLLPNAKSQPVVSTVATAADRRGATDCASKARWINLPGACKLLPSAHFHELKKYTILMVSKSPQVHRLSHNPHAWRVMEIDHATCKARSPYRDADQPRQTENPAHQHFRPTKSTF